MKRRTFQSTLRGARGGIELGLSDAEKYWMERLAVAMETINANPAMLRVWDSELVPDVTNPMVHALLAEQIVNGSIMPIDYTLPAAPILRTMDSIGLQPPADYRIYNRKQADGTYPPLSKFFEDAVTKADASIEALTSAQYGQAGTELGTRFILSGGEAVEFGSPQWFADQNEISF